jgi:hypothetical protein
MSSMKRVGEGCAFADRRMEAKISAKEDKNGTVVQAFQRCFPDHKRNVTT